MISRTIGSAVLLSLAFSGTAMAQTTDPVVLAQSCASCHGVDGKGVTGGTIPPINGRAAAAMATAMKDFKADKPVVTMMNRLAKGYTDAEIDAIAAYYANIK